jgi:hypothetical protein
MSKMKSTFLTTKLGVFCLMGFSICLTDAWAANQIKSTKTVTTVTKASSSNPGFINKSKMGWPNSGAGYRFRPVSTVRSVNSTRLQSPPAPQTIMPLVNKSKPAIIPGSMGMQGDQVVLQSRDIGSFGSKWQSFSDYLSVPKGCEQIPFYITFTNGPTAARRFQDLRISVSGKPIASMKDFGGQPILTRNLSGALTTGDSLLTIQALGPTGAQLNWKLSTPKIVVNRVNPNAFSPADKVIVEGRNFSDRAGVTQVFIDNKPATVISAKSNSLEIRPPKGILGGKTTLYVMIGGQKSAPIQVTIKGAPEIQSVSMLSTAPGQPLTITGTGFSANTAENQVTIGGYPAEITSVSPTAIQCIVPLALDAINPAYDLPVKVKTNKMESTDPTNSGKINIQLRVF